MNWIAHLGRTACTGPDALWRRPDFWLTCAAVALPFGSVLFVFRLAPVRARVRALTGK